MSSPTKTQDVRVDQFFTERKHDSIAGALCASCAQLGRTCQSASLDREGRQAADGLRLANCVSGGFFCLSRARAAEELGERIDAGDATGNRPFGTDRQRCTSHTFLPRQRGGLGRRGAVTDWFLRKGARSRRRNCAAPSLFRSASSESCPSGSVVGAGARATQVAQTAGQVRLRAGICRQF